MKSCNQLNYLPLEYSDDIEDSDTNIVPGHMVQKRNTQWKSDKSHQGRSDE